MCRGSWSRSRRGRGEPLIQPVVPFDESAAAYHECVDAHHERSVELGVRFTISG